jgi:ABC-type glutathione transport system ATPase component
VSLLAVDELTLGFGADADVVRQVSFELGAGESLGLLGASGSGKSLTALAVLGLLPPACQWRAGSIRFEGRDLAGLAPGERRDLCGGAMGLVFQEPFTALNPLMTVGAQVAEGLRLHRGLGAADAAGQAAAWLDKVGLQPGLEKAKLYPHQLSGGMRQRALLAMALACRPRLLICDEPTTALDATVQAQILGLLRRLQGELGFALLIISHDLAVIHALAPQALVMEKGLVVERGPVAGILAAPQSPAAARLLRAYGMLEGDSMSEGQGG